LHSAKGKLMSPMLAFFPGATVAKYLQPFFLSTFARNAKLAARAKDRDRLLAA